MDERASKRRKAPSGPPDAFPEPHVKLSVPVSASLHVRLRGLAALRGQTIGQVAAEAIEAAVMASGVRLFCQAGPGPVTESGPASGCPAA